MAISSWLDHGAIDMKIGVSDLAYEKIDNKETACIGDDVYCADNDATQQEVELIDLTYLYFAKHSIMGELADTPLADMDENSSPMMIDNNTALSTTTVHELNEKPQLSKTFICFFSC